MKKPKPPRNCYDCGVELTKPRKGNFPLRQTDRSDDHIPPDCLFTGEDRNTNLITVECCFACNQAHGKDDEGMMWIIFDVRNQKRISLELLKSTMHTLTRGRHQAYREELEELIKQWDGSTVAPQRLPVKIHTVLARMVRGLIHKFYGVRGFHKYSFTIVEIEPERRDLLLSQFPQEMGIKTIETGNGIFRADCIVDPLRPHSGLVFLQFFQGHPFCIFYEPPGKRDGHASSFATLYEGMFPGALLHPSPSTPLASMPEQNVCRQPTGGVGGVAESSAAGV